MIKALMKHPEGFQQWTRGIGMIAMRGEAGWVIIDHPSNHYPDDLARYTVQATVQPTVQAPKKRGRPKGSKNKGGSVKQT